MVKVFQRSRDTLLVGHRSDRGVSQRYSSDTFCIASSGGPSEVFSVGNHSVQDFSGSFARLRMNVAGQGERTMDEKLVRFSFGKNQCAAVRLVDPAEL
jgi:hypothetical protein